MPHHLRTDSINDRKYSLQLQRIQNNLLSLVVQHLFVINPIIGRICTHSRLLSLSFITTAHDAISCRLRTT